MKERASDYTTGNVLVYKFQIPSASQKLYGSSRLEDCCSNGNNKFPKYSGNVVQRKGCSISLDSRPQYKNIWVGVPAPLLI
jgi:hypothetical protein